MLGVLGKTPVDIIQSDVDSDNTRATSGSGAMHVPDSTDAIVFTAARKDTYDLPGRSTGVQVEIKDN